MDWSEVLKQIVGDTPAGRARAIAISIAVLSVTLLSKLLKEKANRKWLENLLRKLATRDPRNAAGRVTRQLTQFYGPALSPTALGRCVALVLAQPALAFVVASLSGGPKDLAGFSLPADLGVRLELAIFLAVIAVPAAAYLRRFLLNFFGYVGFLLAGGALFRFPHAKLTATLLMVVVLPVTVGVAHWLSLELGRWLLTAQSRAATPRQRWVDTAVASIAALQIAIVLAMSLQSVSLTINSLASVFEWQSFDWQAFANTARTSPWTAGSMVSWMFMLALIPSAACILLTLGALVTALFPRQWVVQFLSRMNDSDDLQGDTIRPIVLSLALLSWFALALVGCGLALWGIAAIPFSERFYSIAVEEDKAAWLGTILPFSLLSFLYFAARSRKTPMGMGTESAAVAAAGTREPSDT